MSSSFKVEDKIVCPGGYGEVIDISERSSYPIKVKVYKNGDTPTFTYDGKENESDSFPTLFHAGEKPEQWKKKRNVKVVAWANIYKGGMYIYDTKEKAQEFPPDDDDVIAMAVKLTGEYCIVE